jgi:hypothetical protein
MSEAINIELAGDSMRQREKAKISQINSQNPCFSYFLILHAK